MDENNLFFVPNLNQIYNDYLQGIMSLRTPIEPQAQGLQTLLPDLGLNEETIRLFSRPQYQRGFGDENDYRIASFEGYTGDLSAPTGRMISEGGEDPMRPETYQDVLAKARMDEITRNMA